MKQVSATVTDNPQTIAPTGDYPRGGKGIICDIAAAFILLTRVPVPWNRLTNLAPNMHRSLWAFPLVGLCVAVVGGAILYISDMLYLPSLLGACLAILAMIFTTGAFHEDGFADVADGFGGGFERERKLEIMRDSRVGTYGSIAVFMSLALRIIALGSMSLSLGVAALLVSGAVSRFWILCMLKFMPAARTEGIGTAAGVPAPSHILIAGACCLAVCLLLLPVSYIVAVILVAFLSFVAVAFISHRQIGGYTGDVLGAVQQVSEIAILICLLSLWRSAT